MQLIAVVRRARELNHNWISVDEDKDIYSSLAKPELFTRLHGLGEWRTPHMEEDDDYEDQGTFDYPCNWTKAIFNVNDIKVK